MNILFSKIVQIYNQFVAGEDVFWDDIAKQRDTRNATFLSHEDVWF